MELFYQCWFWRELPLFKRVTAKVEGVLRILRKQFEKITHKWHWQSVEKYVKQCWKYLKLYNISVEQALFHIYITHDIIHPLVRKIGGSHILVSQVFWYKLIIDSFWWPPWNNSEDINCCWSRCYKLTNLLVYFTWNYFYNLLLQSINLCI